jgi:hypothetical protein
MLAALFVAPHNQTPLTIATPRPAIIRVRQMRARARENQVG